MSRPPWNDDLVDAYLKYGWIVVHDGEASHLEWAYHSVCEIVDRAESEDVLALVLALISKSPDELLSYVAAGPLEDLLCLHGPNVIGTVLKSAHKDERLRIALQGVWGQNRMDSATWERLQSSVREWRLH
jgi:hypothetical protein